MKKNRYEGIKLAKAKKTNKFSQFISNLSEEDLKILAHEVETELNILSKENSLEKRMEKAVIMRNSLKFDQKAYVKIRNKFIEGTVICISPERVRLQIGENEKKWFSILNLVDKKIGKEEFSKQNKSEEKPSEAPSCAVPQEA